MGKKFELKSAAEVESTAEALGEATASLTKVLMKMRDAKMETAHFPWTQRQWDSLDVIITLASQCEAVIQAQVVAHQQGRPSQFAVIKQRSARDVAKRTERKSASTAAGEKPAVKKPRGRPRKKTAGA